MTNESVSHYRVLDKLGEGATAVVYRAEDLALGREVALKCLSTDWPADYGRIARFEHEARTIASLNHPNICTIYEIGEHQGRHFIAMELLDGAALARSINARPVDSYRVVELAIEIADALAAAHAEGIVHRDLKPANIFVTTAERVKLLDFGLAILVPRHSTDRAASVPAPLSLTGGTIPYMSPEQASGESLDPRTDLFSFGIVMYELVTGRRPFVGTTAADVMDAILHAAPISPRDLNPSIPTELVRIVDKSLEKNRKLRYQTASDLRADLQRLKRDLDSTSSVIPRSGAAAAARVRVGHPRRARKAALGGGLVVAAGMLLAIEIRSEAVIAPPVPPPMIRPAGSDIALPIDPPSGRFPAVRRIRLAPVDSPPRADVRPEEGTGGAVTLPHVAAASATGDADLRIARQKIDLKLYDQALETLQRVTAADADARETVDAYFLIASIHDARGKAEDAMSTYLEAASRYPGDARAPEALYQMAESTLKSKRPDRDDEARRMLTDLVARYPASAWAPRALMRRADLEARHDLYQRDEDLGGSAPSALVTYRQVAAQYASSPFGAQAAWKLAQGYELVKRFDLAVAAFEALGGRDNGLRDEAWFAAGDLYDKRLKDPGRARIAYAQVRPSSSRYGEAQKRLRK